MNEMLNNMGYLLDKNTMVWCRENYCGIPYSDGDAVEMRIFDAVYAANDVSLFSCELQKHCTDWASTYHLSPSRANLLRPFANDLAQKDVLEIGAGCGAITRFLGESGANVLALEGSRRRASIAALRTQDLDNTKVLSDDFNTFDIDYKFDFITLIGVLEYAPLFTKGDHPVLQMLKRVSTLLKPNGQLILAIENQLGLKYLAGFPEDHLGVPMYGVEARYKKTDPITFGKRTLVDACKQSGFSTVNVLAPFPDYKLPTALITEEGFSDSSFNAGSLAWQTARSDRQIPACYSLVLPRVWPEVIRNGMGMDMANSFLIVAGIENELPLSDQNEKPLAYYFTSERRPEYCKQTVFRKSSDGTITVVVDPLASTSSAARPEDILTFKLPTSSEHLAGSLLLWEFIDLITCANWSFENVKCFLQRYIAILESIAFRESGEFCSFTDLGQPIPQVLFDCIPQNIILDNQGGSAYFDAEWVFNEELSFGYVLFRCLLQMADWVSLYGVNNSHREISQKTFLCRSFEALGYQLNETHLACYEALENRVQQQVTGRPSLAWKLTTTPFYKDRRVFDLVQSNHERTQTQDEHIQKLSNQLEYLTQQTAQRDEKILSLTQQARTKDEQLSEKDDQLSEKDNQLSEKDNQIKQKDLQLQATLSELHTIINQLEHQRIERLYDKRKKSEVIYKMLRPVRSLKRLLQLLLFPRRELDYYRFEREVLKTDLFDFEYYLSHNEDLIPGCIEVLRHFHFFGWREGRNPGPNFDVNNYLATNHDISQTGTNPLLHYLLHGITEGRHPIPALPLAAKPEPCGAWVPVLIDDGGRGRSIPKTEEPLFSIVVSVYNQWHYTANCLASIVDHTDFASTPYEIILADDCSSDLTQCADRLFPGVRRITTARNVGYLQNTNNGVNHARGTYVVLLNNDTIVQEGWLEEVLNTFDEFPQAGMVGSLLCSPDGLTMDSGNLIMADGSGHCCGRGFLPDHSSYCYVREVHYCTAACTTIRKTVWDEVGGYDERFSPSYYEDSDIAMSIREKGYQVLIQPYSRVVHFENVSHGDSALSHIEDRKSIFTAKWEKTLKAHPVDMKSIFLAKDLSETKQTIVVMEGWVPAWDTNAGARCFLHFIRAKQQLGYNVKLVFQYSYPETYMEYLTKYQKMGFEVWHPSISNVSWQEWLKVRAYAIDAVFIHRHEMADLALHWIKNVIKKPVLFFNHDLHFLRMEREKMIDDSSYSCQDIEDTKQKELLFLTDADVSLSPSLFEVAYLKKEHGLYGSQFMPLFAYDSCTPLDGKLRKKGKIVFVAGFRHQPNLNSLFWFVENCWEELLSSFPYLELHIIGSYPPAEVSNCDGQQNIFVHGYVSDDELATHYRSSHLAVIPLLTGAGLKGKLLEALHYGIPTVGTSVALEGCPDIETVASPCDTPEAFIDDVSRLLTDDEECRRRSVQGQTLIATHFSVEAIKNKMSSVIEMALKRARPCSPEQRRRRLNDLLQDSRDALNEDYIEQNPGSHYTGLGPAVCAHFYQADCFQKPSTFEQADQYILPDIEVPKNYDPNKKHALIISPVHSEFGQGSSVVTKLRTKILQTSGFVIHYVYYPTDRGETLDSGKTMSWDYVYEVKDQSHQILKLKYDNDGTPLPNAHLLDDWCSPELVRTVKALSESWCFDVCLCNYIWLSKCLTVLPSSTLKILATIDVFSYRDSDPNVLGGKEHSGWYATTPSQEKDGLRRADYVLAVQDDDADFFGNLISPEKIRVVRTTLPKRYQAYAPPKGKVVVGYLAGVNPFNIQQLTNLYDAWFADNELTQHAELLIAGSIGKWCQVQKKMSRAKICGFVDEIDDFYAQCNILVNPDFGGTGIKIKCVEALSFGKALVATKRSMNGIASDEPCHLVDSVEEFIMRLKELCNDSSRLEALTETSRVVYDAYCSECDATSTFSEILSD